MKIEFEQTYLQELYENGKSSDKKHRYQQQVVNGYVKCVKALQDAQRMEELFTYNSLRYEKLKGDKKGISSLRINDQYRLEFRELQTPNNILEIEICSLIEISNHYK